MIIIKKASKNNDEAPYGYCPKCNAKGVSRERSKNGNTKCSNGHIYLSSEALERKVL